MDLLPVVVDLLVEATQAEPGSIDGATPLTSLEGWDSMGVVHYLGELAARWPTAAVSADEVAACVTVADLARLTAARL